MSPSPPPSGVRRIPVALGTRSYDVLVGPGLITGAGSMIAQRFPGARVAIVTDANVVAAGHAAALEASLAGNVASLGRIELTPGEATKSFRQLAQLTEQLLSLGVERGDLVIALGGGVIGDLAGFAASIVRRGMRFVQVPTTLLAQVNSSVGGKTGINTAQGKNLAGAFHQPSLVLADTTVLASLPPRQLHAGYAEIAKHAVLGDSTYFAWLEINYRSVFAHDSQRSATPSAAVSR